MNKKHISRRVPCAETVGCLGTGARASSCSTTSKELIYRKLRWSPDGELAAFDERGWLVQNHRRTECEFTGTSTQTDHAKVEAVLVNAGKPE